MEKEISWQALGQPRSPGDIHIPGIGIIEVEQRDIDLAKDIGGNPTCELKDRTTRGDRSRRYVIALIN